MEIVLGAAVVVLTQLIKMYFKTDSWKTWGVALVISLMVAWGYTAIVNAGLWPVVLHILEVAGLIYTFIITRLEAVMNPQ